MNKTTRCFMHLACIVRKLSHGSPVRWHVEHLMREFHCGIYAQEHSPRLKTQQPPGSC